jgi:hypothetical protein
VRFFLGLILKVHYPYTKAKLDFNGFYMKRRNDGGKE